MAAAGVPLHRPFTSFAEFSSKIRPDGKKQGNTWFAYDADQPLGWFAGIYAPQWTSVRKTSEGVITTDLFAFLTTEPNDIVGAANPDSMPVILTTLDEIETWLTAPWESIQACRAASTASRSPTMKMLSSGWSPSRSLFLPGGLTIELTLLELLGPAVTPPWCLVA